MKNIPNPKSKDVIKDFDRWLQGNFNVNLEQLAKMAENETTPCMCKTCGSVFNLDINSSSGYCYKCRKVTQVLNPFHMFEEIIRGKEIKVESTSVTLPDIDIENPLNE